MAFKFRGKEIFKPLNTGTIDNRKVLLKDGQVLDIEGIKVECIQKAEAP